MAFSTPLFLLYANCRGSSLPSVCLSTWCNIILSKHFMIMGVRATGQKSLSSTGLGLFGTGLIIDFFHRAGMVFELTDKLNSLAITPACIQYPTAEVIRPCKLS